MPLDLATFPFRTIVFDLDGTLIDSARDVGEAVNRVLAEHPVRTQLSELGDMGRQGDFITLPLLLNCVGSIFILNGWPCSACRRGFGSNVSTWDGPPLRKK